MKSNSLIQVLSLGLLILMVSACSSNKLAVQNNNDDVYFSDVKAHQADYAVANDQSVAPEYDRNSQFNDYSLYDRYSWRNNYLMNSVGFDPYWGPTNFYNFYSPYSYGNGWSFSLGYTYNPVYGYYNTNNWNYYGGYYGWSPYWVIYSYYRPGYYGSYYSGNYLNNYYYDQGYLRDTRNLNPRPSGAYDNMRPANSRITGTGTGTGNPTSRPVRPDFYNPGNSTRTVDNTRTSSSPISRPVRPTSAPRPTSIPSSQPESRPSRSERPSSPPPSSSPTRTSTGGSSNSGGSSGGRPVRPGGH